MKAFIHLSLLIAMLAPPGGEAAILRELYEQTRNLVQDRLYPICSPKESVFVTVGRSPTPIHAFLDRSGALVFNLPLTYAVQIREAIARDRALRQLVWEHFERFLPEPRLLSGRRLCAVDLRIVGASLGAARGLLSEFYLERYGFHLPLKTIGLDEQVLPGDVDASIDLSAYNALYIAMNLAVTDVSPYGPWFPVGVLPPGLALQSTPSRAPAPRVLRPEYRRYADEMFEYMEEDRFVRWQSCFKLLDGSK